MSLRYPQLQSRNCRRTVLRLLALLMGAVLGIQPLENCFALLMTIPATYKFTSLPGWPQGLSDLLNTQPLVHGYWFNGNITAFYRGTTEEFGKFIAEYAKINDIKHELVIKHGRGQAKAAWSNLHGEEPFACDWQVSIPKGGRRQGAESKPFSVIIELYAESQVRLDELTLPETVDVQRASE